MSHEHGHVCDLKCIACHLAWDEMYLRTLFYLFLREFFIPLVFANFQFSPVAPVIDTAINAGHPDSNTLVGDISIGSITNHSIYVPERVCYRRWPCPDSEP